MKNLGAEVERSKAMSEETDVRRRQPSTYQSSREPELKPSYSVIT